MRPTVPVRSTALAAALIVGLPALAFAAGSDTSSGTVVTPPKPTETTTACKGVKVWDASRRKCVNPRGSSLDEKTLGDAVRELAYAGRLDDAQEVMRAMPDQEADLVLTYWGFTHRKLGDMTLAHVYYDKALTVNPDNILARSYLGQAHVTEGDMDAARAQLAEIRARGGTGTWPEQSLAEAISSGRTYDY
jgi:tetratricopeptide (TPR) repeat protein